MAKKSAVPDEEEEPKIVEEVPKNKEKKSKAVEEASAEVEEVPKKKKKKAMVEKDAEVEETHAEVEDVPKKKKKKKNNAVVEGEAEVEEAPAEVGDVPKKKKKAMLRMRQRLRRLQQKSRKRPKRKRRKHQLKITQKKMLWRRHRRRIKKTAAEEVGVEVDKKEDVAAPADSTDDFKYFIGGLPCCAKTSERVAKWKIPGSLSTKRRDRSELALRLYLQIRLASRPHSNMMVATMVAEH